MDEIKIFQMGGVKLTTFPGALSYSSRRAFGDRLEMMGKPKKIENLDIVLIGKKDL